MLTIGRTYRARFQGTTDRIVEGIRHGRITLTYAHCGVGKEILAPCPTPCDRIVEPRKVVHGQPIAGGDRTARVTGFDCVIRATSIAVRFGSNVG